MPLETLKAKYADYRLNKINKMEMNLNQIPGVIHASYTSTEKKMPDKLEITLKTLPKQLSIAKNMEITVKSLHKNPENPETEMDLEFKEKFENYTHSLGIDNIGYTEIPEELIFKDRSVLYKQAIVLTMEMDENAVNAAPSPQTQENGVVTYDELGKKTNLLAEYLRDNGFGAHASHPAGGLAIYTRLAQKAGLGKIGRHGMLITSEFGPRQRISVIFISAENLNEAHFHEYDSSEYDSSEHYASEYSWMSEFCARCGGCIKKCPTQAIAEKEIAPKLTQTKIVSELCEGCTICMKECSFNKRDYAQIKSRFLNKLN